MPDPASTKQTTADLVAELRDPLKVLRNSEKAAIASALERLESANLLLVADRDDWLQKAKAAREDEIVRRANASRSEFIPADELLSALESATRDTSPTPATDETVAFLREMGEEFIEGYPDYLPSACTEIGKKCLAAAVALAAVGPALARLAELKLTVSQLRCEVSAYRADLRELLPIKARLIEAIKNAEATVFDIIAPEDLRDILTGSDAEKGKT